MQRTRNEYNDNYGGRRMSRANRDHEYNDNYDSSYDEKMASLQEYYNDRLDEISNDTRMTSEEKTAQLQALRDDYIQEINDLNGEYGGSTVYSDEQSM